jgi:hypothetical protein
MNNFNTNICTQVLVSGKNKGKQCTLQIACTKNNLCVRHNNIRLAKNYKKHGNYGNPAQAELWVKWVMNVDKSADNSGDKNNENNENNEK